MKKIRRETFETNSSSTHALTTTNNLGKDYTPFGNNIKIRFFDEEEPLVTLEDKVSYLVSHIISWYKWNAENYEDLIEQVKENRDFKKIEYYVQERYGKRIVFPEKYDGDLEDIVEINHQLQSWEHDLDEVLRDMVDERDLLDEVLSDGKMIIFGRD